MNPDSILHTEQTRPVHAAPQRLQDVLLVFDESATIPDSLEIELYIVFFTPACLSSNMLRNSLISVRTPSFMWGQDSVWNGIILTKA